MNSSAREPQAIPIHLRGGAVRSARVSVLTSTDIHAHNTFAKAHAVSPRERALPATGAAFIYQAPAASVNVLQIELI